MTIDTKATTRCDISWRGVEEALEYGWPDGIGLGPLYGEDRILLLRRAATYMLRGSLDWTAREVRQTLRTWNEAYCSPPLPDRDVLALMAQEWEA